MLKGFSSCVTEYLCEKIYCTKNTAKKTHSHTDMLIYVISNVARVSAMKK